MNHWTQLTLTRRDSLKLGITSQSLPVTWPRTTVIRGDFVESVLRAKDAAEGHLVCFGGAGFVSALLRNELVDELQLYVNPESRARAPRSSAPTWVGRASRSSTQLPPNAGS